MTRKIEARKLSETETAAVRTGSYTIIYNRNETTGVAMASLLVIENNACFMRQ